MVSGFRQTLGGSRHSRGSIFLPRGAADTRPSVRHRRAPGSRYSSFRYSVTLMPVTSRKTFPKYFGSEKPTL